MLWLALTFACLVSSAVADDNEDTADYEAKQASYMNEYCYEQYSADNYTNLWPMEVDGSDGCKFNCYDGVTRVSPTLETEDMTPCAFGRCVHGECLEESPVLLCLKELQTGATLQSYSKKECALTCTDTQGNEMNTFLAENYLCEKEAEDPSDGPTYGFCSKNQCKSLHEFDDEQTSSEEN